MHKLEKNPEQENNLINYVPKKYVWHNFYTNDNLNSIEIDTYIEDFKSKFTSPKYIEMGQALDIYIIYGDEVINFNNEYYSIDFANLGEAIYFTKSNHIPSNYYTKF